MLRLIVFLFVILIMASAWAWLADNPGNVVINWRGQLFELSVFIAINAIALLVASAVVLWSVLGVIWRGPATVGGYLNRRRHERGLEALSSGMIAIGAGDRDGATRFAQQARKALPNEPMTHLLRAQAAQLSGDGATSRQIFEAMLATPDTEQLGLRGLYLEADRAENQEAARQFAERAMALNPKLSWPVIAMFDIQCREQDWNGAIETLTIAKRHRHFTKPVIDRRRAVLLTARAQALEDNDPERARRLALDAHRLAPELVPAAAIAGRLLAARGQTRRAAKVLQRTWKHEPHPDLAVAYAYARLGDSANDRMDRVRYLTSLRPHSPESPVALADAAIEAKEWATARHALNALSGERLTQRVCVLMARIEAGEHGDTGRVREWLARALHAPRDPAWTADGVVSEQWAPTSPVTGELDAFTWRVPTEITEQPDEALLAEKLEQFVRLGPAGETAIEATATTVRPTVKPAAATETEEPARDVTPAPTAQAAPAVAEQPADPPKPLAPAAPPPAQRQAAPKKSPPTTRPAPKGKTQSTVSPTNGKPAAAKGT